MESLQEALQKAQDLNRNKHYTQVIDLLEGNLLASLNSADLYAEKAQAYYNLGEKELCNQTINEALQIDKMQVIAIFLKGGIYSSQKDHDKAMEFYRKAIELDPAYVNPYNGLGNVYFDQKEYDKAMEFYRKAIELDPAYVYPYHGLGNAYNRKKEHDKAIEFYQKAIELDPAYVNPYNGLGNVYFDQKEYDKAVDSYRKAIELAPAYVYPYNGLGNVYNRKKEYGKAVESYRKAIELDPAYVNPYNGLGNVYFDQKEYDKAIEFYRKAIVLDPTYVNTYYGLGNVYSIKKEYDKAMELYRKAIELDPKFPNPYHGLGNVYKSQRKYDKAVDSYRKAIELDPKYDFPYYGLGSVYFAQKEYDKAIKYYQKAIKLDPKFSPPYYGLGNVYRTQEEYTKAINSFQKAIELDPEFGFPHFSRGLLYEDIKEYQKALDDFVRFIELSKTSSDYFTELARNKIIELKKIIANADYTEISELVSKIKDLLLFKGQSVTHYTGMTVAKMLILESSAFRLSEGVFLNDPSEGRELFKFISSIEISNSNSDTVAIPFTPKPFIGSFVAEAKHDDLTLWRMYGKENKEEARGCAITLNKDLLLQNLKNSLTSDSKTETFTDKPETANVYDEEFQFYNVAYRQINSDNTQCFLLPDAEAEELALLNKYMQDLAEKVKNARSKKDADLTNIVELLNTIAYLFKSAEYHYEHELRLIIKGIGFEKKFFEGTQPPRVYIELVPIQSIITKITLGPKIESADEWAAYIYYRLDKLGCNPQIMISHLPFK